MLKLLASILHPSVIKGRLKKDFAHLDVCSNDKLNNMAELVQVLVKVLPRAYREYLDKKRYHDLTINN